MQFKVTMLGCGTSVGVPTIGCRCRVCTSPDARNKRSRASLLVSANGKNILVDTSPDLRLQALELSVDHVDAVLFTHCHSDHVNGIDDLRAFRWGAGPAIPCYADMATLEEVGQRFPYVFREGFDGEHSPMLEPRPISGPFTLFGLCIEPIPVLHGDQLILGFRFCNVAYLTDCSGIPELSKGSLHGLELLIIGSLRHEPHPKHFTLQEAVAAAGELDAQQVIFTHMGHQFDYEETNCLLPDWMRLGYDGLVEEFGH